MRRSSSSTTGRLCLRAIFILLEQLDLRGAIVTTDAMGTQTAIARQICSVGADYISTLKANHPTLAQDAHDWFKRHQHEAEEKAVHTTEFVCEAGHHRIEKRCFFSVPVDQLFCPERIKQWTGVKTLIVEQSSPKGYRFAYRQLWNKTTHSTRFFLSSLKPDFDGEARCFASSLCNRHVADFPHSIRSHWGVENQLHWCLDVVFDEDDSRIRQDHAPHNMTILTHTSSQFATPR